MSRTIKLFSAALLAGLIFVASPQAGYAQSGGHFETDFTGGVPAEITLGVLPASCDNSSGDRAKFGAAVWSANGGASNSAALKGTHHDETVNYGVAGIVFPHLVTLAVANATAYGNTGSDIGNNSFICDGNGDYIDGDVGGFGGPGPKTVGVPAGAPIPSVAAIYWTFFSDPAHEVYLDDVDVDYVDSGTPFDHTPFTGSAAGIDLFKPISGYDLVHISDSHSVIETRPNANVHAVTDGQITLINANGGGNYSVRVQPAWSLPGDVNAHLYFNLQNVNGKVGDQISAGCVLGITARSTSSSNADGGQLAFTAPEPVQSDWPDYDDAPENSPCDAARYKTESCIDINPNFADEAKGWNMVGPVGVVGGAVEMPAGTSIYQDVTLDPEATYLVSLSVAVMGSAQPTDIDVGFGDAQPLLHVNPTQPGVYVDLQTQTLSPGVANFVPNLYRLKITNPHLSAPFITPTIRIKFACIGTSAPVKAPGSCYFEDPDLRNDEWTKGDGVTYTPSNGSALSSGEYTIPADSEIYRNVKFSAFSGHDTSFRLLTKTNNGGTLRLVGPYGRWHAFIRDHDTLDTVQDIGTWDTLPGFVTIRVVPFTVTSGTNINADLVIQNTSSAIESPGWDLNIYEACLQVEGGVWPGYSSADTGSLVPENCTLCAKPAMIADISVEQLLSWVISWLDYGWCFLGYIIRCELMKWLNDTWDFLKTVFAVFGLFGVWLGMVVSALAVWAADGARFLFNNLLAGLVPVLNSLIAWLLAQPFIQGAFDMGSLALIFLFQLVDIVIGIFNLFGLAIQLIGAFFTLIGTVWSAFLEGINATPTAVFLFPDCTNPATLFYDGCLVFDVSNFLFAHLPMLGILINVLVFSIGWLIVRKSWSKTQEVLNG
jgi:hypothetical protein